MTTTPPPPFKVARDGTVTHREGGHVIGRVALTSEGWRAYGLGDSPIAPRHWNGRKYAARAVWNVYTVRNQS